MFRNRNKLIIGSLAGLVVVISTFLLIQYFHVQVFKSSLAALVESGTAGKYSLDIAETDIEFLNFKFLFSDLVIESTDENTNSGILQVRIPKLEVSDWILGQHV